jgi:hypothetical protein
MEAAMSYPLDQYLDWCHFCDLWSHLPLYPKFLINSFFFFSETKIFIYLFIYLLLFIQLFICAYPPHFQAEHVLPCSSILLKRKQEIIRKTSFLLAWDKDRYTERFVALLPFTCIIQPKFVHLYQISSLLPGHLLIVSSVQFKITLFTSLQWAH